MRNKLKVSTRTSSSELKHKKILEALRLYPEGCTPKVLSRETLINVNTIKSILPRLKGVKKIHRGYYKVVERGDGTLPSDGELKDWNFHNLVLTAKTGAALVGGDVYDFGLVKFDLNISQSGKATLRVSTDYPLNVSSICVVAGFFRFLVPKLSDIMISTIEFNKDYSNLRLDGLRSITVDSLVEQFKVYQKKRGLRVEHKTKVPLAVEGIVDMLRQNPNSLDHSVRLERQEAALDRLALATSNNTKILLKLIDRKPSVETP